MKKLVLAIGALIVLIVGGLAALPLFLSAETIRNELAARIEAATGRATRIDGPISFSVFPTAHLSANGIGLAGIASDSEAFSVESVSFGLSLLPLLSGNIDIYGVTITRPVILVETDENGRSNWSAPEPPAQAGAAPSDIESMIEAQQGAQPSDPADNHAPDASSAIAALDRLSIGRIRINDGNLIWRDRRSGREETVSRLNLDISVPRLDGAGTIEGEFTRLGIEQTIKARIGERPDPTRFEQVPVELSLSSEAGELTATGTALAGETLFDGTVEAKGDSFRTFAGALGASVPDLPAFGPFTASVRLAATGTLVQIPDYAVDLNGLQFKGGAAVALDRSRPGIGLKIEADRIDTALLTPPSGSGGVGGSGNSSGADQPIDLSALDLVDANIDFSAREIAIGSVPLNNLGLDIRIGGGNLDLGVRSATVNGAPGTGRVVVDRSGGEPVINGEVKMSGLDAAGLLRLAGVESPVDAGNIGLDVTFATRGSTSSALMAALDGRGTASLLNGHLTGLGLADLVGGDAGANEIDDVDVVAEFSSLAAPVTARGGFGWRGERFDFSAVGSPRDLAAGNPSPVEIRAESSRVALGYKGTAGLSGLGSGAINVSTASLRNLLAWIGRPMGAGAGLGPFSIEGTVDLAADSFSFENAAFTLDGSSGRGNGRLAFGGTPKLTAGLALQVLDVTPYLGSSGGSGAGGSSGGSSGGGGWSTAPLGFEGLRALDADLNLRAEEIRAGKIRLGPAAVTATLTGGRLSAELAEMALYSGSGAGTLKVDGAASTPSIAISFRLLDVSALEFLTDAIGLSRVEGRGSFAFDLSAAGASQAALVASLDGDGAIDVRDGAIRGINIPEMVRTLSIQTLLGWQQSNDAKTDFSQLSGSFKIDDGILANDDLTLVGPLLRVTGAGRVDIPKQTIAYRVDPKIVASLEGQGSSSDLQGFAVPVRIEGSWSQPRIYPEIEGILQNPQAAFEQLRQLGGGLFGSGGAISIPGLGQGQQGQEPGQGQQPDNRSIEDRLKDEALRGLGQILGGGRQQQQQQAPQVQPEAQPAPQPEAMPAPEPAPAAQQPPPPPEQSPPPETPKPEDQARDLLRSLFGQ